MDFTPLTSQELEDFLSFNGILPDYDFQFGNNRGRLERQASDLFDRLSSDNTPGFTEPIVDFYVASLLKPSINSETRYERSVFDRMTPEELRDYADQIGLPWSEHLKERLFRILNYLKVLTPVTFGQLLRMLSAPVCYRIMVNSEVEVDDDATEDLLYRNIPEEFKGLDIDRFSVWEGNILCISIDVHVDIDEANDDLLEVIDNPEGFLVTKELLQRILPDTSEGKLVIPRSFRNYAVVVQGLDREILDNVEYVFDHINTDDPRLLDYIIAL